VASEEGTVITGCRSLVVKCSNYALDSELLRD
jgi:hypothetical protein